jgi:hypothetical protein
VLADKEIAMDEQPPSPPTFWQMLHSVLAAALGVQSSKNRARDFSQGKPGHFIALGLFFTLVFVLILVGVVKLVLHLAGL